MQGTLVQGKTILMTGATSGIGLEAAAVLASHGARLLIVGRDAARTDQAVAAIHARSGVRATPYLCDFASLADVTRLADAVSRDVRELHVLINNAGRVFARRTLTVDGHEATLAVNHLAHFLLTRRLLPLLQAGAPARVITVASGAHTRGSIDFDDLTMARGYQILRAYSRSKLANVLFASELARRLAGTGVSSNSVHPGRVATNIWSNAPAWARPLIRFWFSRTFISAAEGATPLIALASRADLAGVTGQYFNRHDAVAPSALAQDAELAARLWDASDAMTR